MFRWLTSILLLTAFAVQSFSQVLIVAEYYTNTAAFAKNCENKARPVLKCQGKCQMMKKLQEEEKKNNQSSERKGDIKNEVVSSKSFFTQLPISIKAAVPVYAAYLSDYCPIGKATDIFHPPLLF